MENILDIVEEPGPDINESNLFRNIWLHPTATLRYILRHCPEKYVHALFLLGGAVRGMERAVASDSGEHLNFFLRLGIAVIGGAIGGWIGYHIYVWAMRVTGRWLKGNGSFNQIRTVMAWSLVPIICTIVLYALQFLLFGQDVLTRDLNFDNIAYSVGLIVMGLIGITLGIWSLVILVKGVALVNGFSAGRAFLNVVLPIVIMIGLVLLVVGFAFL